METATGTISPEKKQKNEKEDEVRKGKERRLERLQSRLAHLTRKPYYDGHLDLSRENLARWLDAAENRDMLAAARLRASTESRRRVHRTLMASTYTPSHVMHKHFGGGMCGLDRDGSPVYFLLLGLTDMLGILESCTKEQFLVFWSLKFEAMIDQLKEQKREGKKNIHNVLLIVDFKGCNMHTFCWAALEAWAKATQIYEDLNPGLFKEIVLINASNALPIIHRTIYPAFKYNFRDRVTMIGAANMLKHLLVRMEKHEIPAYLGGYKCDVDNNPYCKQAIVWPLKVPQWRYLTNPCLPAYVIDLTVEAGGIRKEKLKVPVAGTRITWRLHNVTHPVLLVVTPPDPPPAPDSCRNPLQKPLPLFMTILKKQEGQQAGAVHCSNPGIYSFVLDNRKDMIHTVRAKVKLDVVTPAGYIASLEDQLPVGDSINFYRPITNAERKRRKDISLLCNGYASCKINANY
ncbi:hypothetical protein RRG08_027214 [Elysia crispata]|uniref:CRAL-TRIO domain-containing protein n=1 Tax=Elysia crispata TaxID=231223 RepID=A0AAE1DTS2_9GAST|nr:hypothetical protein RRG08_027214 [Elysia crispata]